MSFVGYYSCCVVEGMSCTVLKNKHFFCGCICFVYVRTNPSLSEVQILTAFSHWVNLSRIFKLLSVRLGKSRKQKNTETKHTHLALDDQNGLFFLCVDQPLLSSCFSPELLVLMGNVPKRYYHGLLYLFFWIFSMRLLLWLMNMLTSNAMFQMLLLGPF